MNRLDVHMKLVMEQISRTKMFLRIISDEINDLEGRLDMAYYKTCPHCGAHLDPGEKCDCRGKRENPADAANADEVKNESAANTNTPIVQGENGGCQE